MENKVYKHILGSLIVIHLAVSHWQNSIGNLSTALIAVSLVGLLGWMKWLEKQEQPDMRKEFAAFKKDMEFHVDNKLGAFESSLSKYEAFMIKNPQTASKSIRF
jgi:hypothetical protein